MLAQEQESSEERFIAIFGPGRSTGLGAKIPSESPTSPSYPDGIAFHDCDRRLHFEPRSWGDENPLIWVTAGAGDGEDLTFSSTVRSWREHPTKTLLCLAQALCGDGGESERSRTSVAHDNTISFASDGSYVRIHSDSEEHLRLMSDFFRSAPTSVSQALVEALALGGENISE